MATTENPGQPIPQKGPIDQRRLVISATGLLKFALILGWKGMTGLAKFAFKIPGMFVSANRRTTKVKNVGCLALLFLSMQLLPGCAAIAGIFKAGVWVGVLAVVVVIAIIIFIISKVSGGGKS